MKIVTISDTHGLHRNLVLGSGDMIIHAGDVSSRGKEAEILAFLNWYKELPFTYKIFIAGNHDFFFEKESKEAIAERIPSNIIYLNDSGINIEGINIWGSPITPWFFNWAFNRRRGAEIRAHWDLIPSNTDILVTHGPAYDILDRTTRNESVGCQDLHNKIGEIKPKVHICGHIHEGYGKEEKGGTTFYNASVLDEDYRMKNVPIEFEI